MESKYVDIHSHVASSGEDVLTYLSFDILDEIDTVGEFWAGLHPYNYRRYDESIIPKLQSLLIDNPKFIGVGEIGLDYSIKDVDREAQKMAFVSQLNFACENNLPVTIHCVKAHNDMYQVLRGYNSNFLSQIIMHSFVGSWQLAESFVSLGCMLSFSARSMESGKTVDAIKLTPLSNIFIESDSEKHNIHNIRDIYVEFCTIKDINMRDLNDEIEKNRKKILKK